MRACRGWLCLVLMLATCPVAAQVTTDDLQDPGPRNGEVTSAARWEKVDDQVRYLRPGAAFEPDGRIEVRLPPRPEREGEDNRLGTGIVFGAILFAIVLAFILYGNRINVSFTRTSEGRRVTGDGVVAADGLTLDTGGDQSLDEIAAMPDRREALIRLVSRGLERAAGANDLRLARAQTARDVLRALPRGWGHLAAMRRLVREAEVVHFGGRDISEARFQDCVALARPIFSTGTRA